MDWASWMNRVHAAKVQFARLINAQPEEIAVTMSVSDATNSIASALRPTEERYRIVTSQLEFPTVGQIWLANQPRGWEVEFVREKGGAPDLEDFAAKIDNRTALVSVTHVCYQTGARTDIRTLGDMAHAHGALFYVDAYQSLGTVPVDVKRDNVDLLASGMLKYLLGIPGIAFLYVKRELAERLSPAATGWFGQANPFAMETTRLDYAPDTRRFDTGTPPVIAAYVAEAGLSIINEVGVDRIHSRIMELSGYAIDKAQELGFAVLGPSSVAERGASVPLVIPNAHQVEMKLLERGIIASARGPALRLAPHFFTLEEEIEAALLAIRELL
jgi:selenocysteine lyase/cysteine desulfurase